MGDITDGVLAAIRRWHGSIGANLLANSERLLTSKKPRVMGDLSLKGRVGVSRL
ncbi:MAG: hypothetical protein LBL62_02740 [Planctomycetaceae bacterium]|nr:hypothetical protein [Planctomycetaceae bacterium]